MQQQPDPNAPIIISYKSSGDEQQNPELVPEMPMVDVVDLAESDEELPDIDPPHQLPLPVGALVEAFMLLHRL